MAVQVTCSQRANLTRTNRAQRAGQRAGTVLPGRTLPRRRSRRPARAQPGIELTQQPDMRSRQKARSDEEKVKEETKATIRVLPDEEFRSAPAPAHCLACGGDALYEAIWARAY